MAAPGSPSDLERLIAILGPRLDEFRSFFDDAAGRWRGDAVRLSEETKRRVLELGHELGFVTRAEWEELELRLAQVEHRLRLLEDPPERP
jgi:polyhydroxyalkanoate synthesis regulator phasin